MFQQVNTPVLGVVENMSGYVCPTCGTPRRRVRRRRRRASRAGLRGAGSGPHPARAGGARAGDAGTPIVVAQPEHPISRLYGDIAEQVLEGIEAERTDAPRIIG